MESQPAIDPATVQRLDRERERELRHAFAAAADPGQAALELAGFLAVRERHEEALFIVEAAIDRRSSPSLRLARAGLLRDLARCDDAANELQGLLQQQGAEKMAPGTLFELAEVEWLAGQRDRARVTLRTLLQQHGRDPWLEQHVADVTELGRQLEQPQGAAVGSMRDLLAMLRTAPVVTARMRLLDRLATPPEPLPPGSTTRPTDERAPLRQQAIAIACADESPALRARAVQLAALNGIAVTAFWQVALADPAVLVRQVAASSSVRVLDAAAAPLLLERLAEDEDPASFAAIAAALAKSLRMAAPITDSDSAAGRAATVSFWRERCAQ